MVSPLELLAILGAALLASGSPGPATLSIASISMHDGRRQGLAFASGVTTGSLIWSVGAALGLGAIMLANAWAFQFLRYFGAAYLMWLALKSARQAMVADGAMPSLRVHSYAQTYLKGLALHLTNPKAILFFGSLYAIVISPQISAWGLATIIVAMGIQSFIVFHGYALLFSNARISRGYFRIRGWMQGAFALAFGAAGLKILLSR